LILTGVGLLILLLSHLGVGVFLRWAKKRQILDIPNDRSLHIHPVPRGGGIVIVFFSVTGFAISWMFGSTWPHQPIFSYLIGAIVITAVSWLDDLRPLPNRIRFAAHSLSAILVILGSGYWHKVVLPFLGELPLGWFGLLITFFWIVGLTNAYNFMDGIDGIAGGQAVVAGTGWTVLGCLIDQPPVAMLGLLLASSSLGFLWHNWPPARIFMGDVGSAFLGYTFAVLPVIAAKDDPRFVLIGVLLVWPFVFDASFTFFRRLRKGENVFTAHRSHLYQRLVIAGHSHRFVTLLYVTMTSFGLALALIWFLDVPGSDAAVTIFLPALCFGLWFFVTRQERKRKNNNCK